MTTQLHFTQAAERFRSMSVRDCYKVANRVGLKGDFGRLYSPKAHNGTPMRDNMLSAMCAADVTAEALALAMDAVAAGAPDPDRSPAVTAAPADPGTALEAIRAILGGGISKDDIRAAVAEYMEANPAAPAFVEIKIGDTERIVEGRTHAEFERVLRIVNTRVAGRRMHVWLTGPSGSGKSHLAKQVADACGDRFYSTGAVQTPFQLIGFVSPAGDATTLKTPFRMAFEFGGVFSWDDCDASDPRAFVAFNEALANGRFAFPDGMVDAHREFVAIASANTWGNGATAEYVGRNKIDGATLTRFVRVSLGYDEALERDLVGSEGRAWAKRVQAVRRAVSDLGVKILITPRHTLQGAALLAAGFPEYEVERMTIFAGIDQPTEVKIWAACI